MIGLLRNCDFSNNFTKTINIKIIITKFYIWYMEFLLCINVIYAIIMDI